MKSNQTCASCRFWLRFSSDDSGMCRRRAPSPVILPGFELSSAESTWPQTCDDDWCGEWEEDLRGV